MRHFQSCKNSNSIEFYHHSQDNKDCHKIFQSPVPQKDTEQKSKGEEWSNSSHKNQHEFPVPVLDKEVCGTEEKIGWDIIGCPKETA